MSKYLFLVMLISSLHIMQTSEARVLNILFVVEYFPAPSQPHIVHLLTGLIDKGHNISIFSFRKNNVPGHPDIAKYSLMNFVFYEKIPLSLAKFDIIFCQSASLGRKIFALKSWKEWLKKRKVVVALRGYDITKNALQENPALYKKLFRQTDLFLPVCNYFKNIALHLDCPLKKIVVYHTAIDCLQFFFKTRNISKQEPVQLVSVCRLIEKKGLNFAIQAIAQAVKKHPQLHYTIVGDGPQRPYLEGLVQQLGLTNVVTFTGWKSPDEIVAILDKAHIFMLPSITSPTGDEEGIANALKESMAMGLISIGTLHAGTPELITDGVTGFLVPEKNSEALANKINYIIEHPKIWPSIAAAARKKIETDFEIKKSIEELENIFYNLLAEKRT